MKVLLVLRHAKSDWSDPTQADRDRPLNKRGKRDGPRMGALLRDEHLLPDLILTSPAIRARQTAEDVARSSSYRGKITVTPSLYGAGPDGYIEALRGVPDTNNRVLVVGHNPDVEALVERLAGSAVVLPTAALAQVELPILAWRDLADDTRGGLAGVWRPRELAVSGQAPVVDLIKKGK